MQYTTGKYGVLFSLLIKHPFFKDEICPYLTAEPDMPTYALFRNRQVLTKNFPGEIRIITSITGGNENGRSLKSATPDLHYTFLLRARDTAFFSVTNLDLTSFPRQILYFFNTAKSTKLSQKKCFVTDGIATLTYEEGKIPSRIKITDQYKTEIYNGDTNKNSQAFVYDMTPYPAGLYTVVSTFAKADQQKPQTQVLYYNPLIKKEPALGVIDIDVTDMTLTEKEAVNNYIIQFETITTSA